MSSRLGKLAAHAQVAATPATNSIRSPNDGKMSDRLKSMGFMSRKLQQIENEADKNAKAREEERTKWTLADRKTDSATKSKQPHLKWKVVRDKNSTVTKASSVGGRKSFGDYNKALQSYVQVLEDEHDDQYRAKKAALHSVGDEEMLQTFGKHVFNGKRNATTMEESNVVFEDAVNVLQKAKRRRKNNQKKRQQK